MSDVLHYFSSHGKNIAVVLPFQKEEAIQAWTDLMVSMVRQCPEEFTRDEWAYLTAFLDSQNLNLTFAQAFGRSVESCIVATLYQPRGPIAMWLPNNVSLLGPLSLVLLSLTGQTLLLKGGSGSKNLTDIFLQYAIDNLKPGALQSYLKERVHFEIFDRHDERNTQFTEQARVRIVFGSDEAAASIHALPHPADSVGFSFINKRSEAWISPQAINDDALATLVKVFAIYGQAGCTSPKRVVLLDSTPEDAKILRDKIVDVYPKVIRSQPAMHIATGNILAQQWASAIGWNCRLTNNNAAAIACGAHDLDSIDSTMFLPIVNASLEEAITSLPNNIQTIGHAIENPESIHWLKHLSGSDVKRFVPLGQMHHFGPIWDGEDFWKQCFKQMEIRQ